MSDQTPNRFGWDDEQGWPQVHVPIQCNTCAHRHPGSGYPSCKAFEEIPVELLTDDFDHTKPYPGAVECNGSPGSEVPEWDSVHSERREARMHVEKGILCDLQSRSVRPQLL